VHIYDREKEGRDIGDAIAQYNRNSASFYNSAGFPAGLEEIPAAPLIKRRLFKDINALKGDGLVLVFDRDRTEITDIVFLNRQTAVAKTLEIWAIDLQDIRTREPVFNMKALEVKVRYLLHKEEFPDAEEKKWIIYSVDVYPGDETIPDLDTASVL